MKSAVDRATRAGERPSDEVDAGSAPLDTRKLVLGAAVLMVLFQVGFRAWALYSSWFYTDDYRLLHDAQTHDLGWSYLALPFDSQFMPFGRALAMLVAGAGHVNWALAASVTLLLQACASAACVWMLSTLFGARWAALAPLGVYLTGAMTMPALMWWAASLNQLPLQIVLFCSVTSWVRYARTRDRRWLALTIGVLAIGLLCYVKTLLVFAVLAYLLLAYFSTGPIRPRLISAVRRYWPAAAAAAALALVFVVYYTTQVPQIFQPSETPLAGTLADSMLGTAFTTGALGGPWRWDASNPPTGYADPPSWTVHLAWCVLLLAMLVGALLRRRTGRAWLLLAGYLATAYVLVLTSRAPVAGALIGLEYRYVTDVVPVLALCWGLATMRLLDAPESSVARDAPLLLVAPGRSLQAALVGALCISGMVSSYSYARIWHGNNPGDDYTHAAIRGLHDEGEVDLANQVVPHEVIPGFSSPYNTTGRLLPLLVDNARFPSVTEDLAVLDDGGSPRRALIQPAVASLNGPDEDCGWKVQGRPVTIPLTGTAFDFGWWVRIGYLGSAADTTEVRMGGTILEAPVRPGLHSIFLRVEGELSSVTIGGLDRATTLCVDTVEVGQPVPGAAL